MKIGTRFKHLFQPLAVGNLLLRNRIIAAPITSYAEEPSPADKMESIAAKVSVELFHGGMFADCRGTGATPIGPCTMERSFTEYEGYERIEPEVCDTTHVIGMDEEMMQRVCDQYAASAREARRMGFDMVMLHFGHGWLADEFLSPFFNHRTDEYGGSIENRMRFPMRIVEAVRRAVGPDYPIDIRIGASERVKESVSLEDITEFILRVEDKIDMVHISSGLDKLVGATSYIEAPSIHPHQLNVPYAEKIRAKVKRIPVVVVGSITMPDEAESIIAEGKADAVALGRALVADPDWVNKARDNRPEDIRTCLRCDSCYAVATGGCSQGCAVNPRYERELRLRAEEMMRQEQKVAGAVSKKIVVVGGGPAGMNAAIAACDMGNRVILMEKEAALGGLLKISDTDETKADMYHHKQYLVAQVKKRDIELRLNCEATRDNVAAEEPDEVIVAVGSYPRKFGVPGAERENVYDIVAAHRANLGHRVAIIGAGPSGCELALSLLRKGHEVTLIEITDRIAAAANLLYRGALEEQFAQHRGLKILTETTCVEILEDAVVTRSVREGDRGELCRIPADNVVYCVGLIPRRELAMSFADIVYDVRMVGDCVAPRRMNEATHEGYFAGRYI